MIITSVNNDKIKDICKLKEKKDRRRAFGTGSYA